MVMVILLYLPVATNEKSKDFFFDFSYLFFVHLWKKLCYIRLKSINKLSD